LPDISLKSKKEDRIKIGACGIACKIGFLNVLTPYFKKLKKLKNFCVI